ncbi:MAG: histidine kinase [Saprospiraceae bacterium]|nr:histidine kinase [Saprospiraceae bacterium]
MGLLVCFSAHAQRLSYKKYGKDDGLIQTEIGGAAILHDSTIIIYDGSNTLKRFDGYKFRALSGWNDAPTYTSGVFNFDAFNVLTSQESFILYRDGIFSTLLSRFKSNELKFKGKVGNNFVACFSDSIFVYYGAENCSEFQMMPEVIKNYCLDEKVYYLNFSDDMHVVDLLFPDSSKNITLHLKDGRTTTSEWPTRKIITMMVNLDNEEALLDLYRFQKKINSSYGSNPHANMYIAHSDQANKGILIESKSDTVFALGKLPETLGSVTTTNDQTLLHYGHGGLYRINPFIHYFPSGEHMVPALHTIAEDEEGKIWFGSYGYGFSFFDKEVKKYDGWSNARILPGSLVKDNVMLFSEDAYNNGIYVWREKKYEKILKETAFIIKFFPINGYVFGSLNYRLIIKKDLDNKHTPLIIDDKKGIGITNILDIEEDNNGRLWLIGKGVDIYDPKVDTVFHFAPRENDNRTLAGISLQMDDKGTLWFGTKNGLFYYQNAAQFDPEKENIQNVAKHIALPNYDQSIITSLLQVDHFLVVGSQKGVSFLDLNSFYANKIRPVIYQLEYGESLEGGGSEQNCLYFDSKRRLWIGSQEGATMIDWDRFEFDKTTSKIMLEKVDIGDEPYQFEKEGFINVPTKKRNLVIEFGLDKNLSLLKNVYFDYALVSRKGDTIVQEQFDQDGVLDIKYLPPGKYQLHIKANKHGQLMDEKNITISVPLSLEENPWTWASLTFSVLGLFTFIFFNKSKQQKSLHEKELALSKLSEESSALRVQSIISSFNPHFIHNSLNWIQSKHMNDADTVRMVDRLSKNIRYIFNHTRKGKAVHTFGEEMTLVKNYLEVQRLRYGDKYEFRLPSEVEIQRFASVQMIIMQIQIHFENAIEHGLRNNEGGGYVALQVSEDENNYQFTIEDNGVGRAKSKELGSQGTQMGTEMLQELHQLFNVVNSCKISQEYEDDIFGESETSFGTRVKIVIPKEYKYELSKSF